MNSKTRTGSCRFRVRTRQQLETGSSSREDVALQPQLFVLTSQPCQLVTLCSGQPATLLLPAALLPVGLRNPVADGLRCRLELAGKLGRITSSANQIDHLATKLR